MSEPRTDAKICGMGHSMKRKEDPRFIRGQGRYIDDFVLPGMLYMDIVRSPHAHARIKKIDTAKTLKIPGVLAVQADGAKITTVEGLEQGGKLHPVQEGFTEKHGLQCGFCTPGMLMTTSALLERNKNPSEQEIREAISGNLCRCTGYVNIVKAVQYAAEKMR